MMLSHADLVTIAVKWLKSPYRNAAPNGHSSCTVVLVELRSAAVEIPDVIGWTSDRSILIEAKASTEDFRADLTKRWRVSPGAGMGDLRYYICEQGIVPLENLPEGWGLLHVVEGNVAVIREAQLFDQKHWRGEMRMLISHIRRKKLSQNGVTT